MCEKCWDADKKAELIRQNTACTGEISPMMTLDQLKTSITDEWKETDKINYKIYEAVLFDPPHKDISWEAINNIGKKANLSVKFI